MLKSFGLHEQALKLTEELYDSDKQNVEVQASILSQMVDFDLNKAYRLQQNLAQPAIGVAIEMGDYIQKLIDDGMPEKRKEKKSKGGNIMETTAGGAEIFIPKKRNRKIKYPKGFDTKNPGPEPDPERWLPKWQQSKFKRLAKKRGIYLKGA